MEAIRWTRRPSLVVAAAKMSIDRSAEASREAALALERLFRDANAVFRELRTHAIGETDERELTRRIREEVRDGDLA